MTELRAEESLGYLTNRAGKLLLRAMTMKIGPYGVGVGQWLVLYYLYQQDGRSQADLGRLVAIEPPTMVRTIDRMVRDGFVERRPDPKDARAVRITLTQNAIDLREPLMAASKPCNRGRRGLGRRWGRRLWPTSAR